MISQTIKFCGTLILCLFFSGAMNAQIIGIGTIVSDPVGGEPPVATFKCGKGTKTKTVPFPITTINTVAGDTDCSAAKDDLMERIGTNGDRWGLNCPEESCNGLGGCKAKVIELTSENSSFDAGTLKCTFDGGSDSKVKIKYKCSPCGDGIVIIDDARIGDTTPTPDGGILTDDSGQLDLFPIPCQSVMTVDMNVPRSLRNIRLEVYDLTGKRVYSEVYGDSDSGSVLTGIDLSHLPPGNYNFKVSTDSGWTADARIAVVR